MDYEALYSELAYKLETQLPFKAYPVRGLVQIMREKGIAITLKTELTIGGVINSGDVSGIVCEIEDTNIKAGEKFICSLVHLIFLPEFSLYGEILEYQKKRQKRIDQLNRG
jgi:hypothetical protein